MEVKRAYDPRDLTVHLRDAALYVWMRGRLLLAAALVGALLLTALRYVGDWRRYRMAQAEAAPITTLSADARARVASAMGYQAAYRRVCAYNETAPLMHVDPGAAPTRRMRLLITGDGCWAAACLYRDYVEAETPYRDAAENGMPAAYLVQLVSVAVESEPTQSAPQRVFLTIQVLAPTEELCNRLSSVVRGTVEQAYAAVAAAAGEHRAVWAFDRYAVLRDETVAARQQSSLEEQTMLLDKHTAAQRALTAEEKAYVQRLAGQNSVLEPMAPPVVNRTAWLWGFLLGGLVGLAWLAVRYLFCGRVLSAADVISRHGTTVLGVLGDADTRWMLRRLRDRPEEETLVWQRLTVCAVTAGVTRLYVSADAERRPRLDGLRAALERQGIALIVDGSPRVDGTAAEALASCDGLVIAAVWGETAHRTIAEEMALAEDWRIPTVGILVWQ